MSLPDECVTSVSEVKRTVTDWASGALPGTMLVITAKVKNLLELFIPSSELSFAVLSVQKSKLHSNTVSFLRSLFEGQTKLAVLPACGCLMVAQRALTPWQNRNCCKSQPVYCGVLQLMVERHRDAAAALPGPSVLLPSAPECPSKEPHCIFFPESSLLMPRLTDAFGKYILESIDTVKFKLKKKKAFKLKKICCHK